MYVPSEEVLGNPGLFGFVAGAVSAVTTAVKKGTAEAHIQDRVAKYQTLTDAQLREVQAKGGEAGEAARRVLAGRGGGAPAVPSGPLIDLSKIIKLPEVSTVSKVDVGGIKDWLLPIGLAVGLGVVLLVAKKGR